MTTGRALMPFKLGAFEPLVPVQPVILHYEDRNWAYCSMYSDVHLGHVMSLPESTVTVKWMPVIHPHANDTPETFANRVRNEMLKFSNYTDAKNATIRGHYELCDIVVSNDAIKPIDQKNT